MLLLIWRLSGRRVVPAIQLLLSTVRWGGTMLLLLLLLKSIVAIVVHCGHLVDHLLEVGTWVALALIADQGRFGASIWRVSSLSLWLLLARVGCMLLSAFVYIILVVHEHVL